MSETIEERAARICHRLDLAHTWNNGGEEAIELIEDLMAERQSVDLDALFPKEIMEAPDVVFEIPHPGALLNKSARYRSSVIQNVVYLYKSRWQEKYQEFDIYAVRISNGRPDEELSRIRVRIGLTVRKLEG